jgi:outer membrane protein assembly factor BamE (lipoprotein component of BamABCDE complex)
MIYQFLVKYIKFAVIIAMGLVSSCINYDNSGYNFENSSPDKLQPQITSKDRVFEMMGSPSFIYNSPNKEIKNSVEDNLTSLDQESGQEYWIYYNQKDRHFLFLKPKSISKRLLIVKFNQDGVVENIDDITKNEMVAANFERKITKVPQIKKENIIFDIYNNIGQVRAQ